MLFLISTVLTLILIGLYGFYQWSFTYWYRKRVNFIVPSFPLGTLVPPAQEQEDIALTRQYLELKKKGPFGGLYFYFAPIGLVIDLNVVKDILVCDFNNFMNRGLYYNEKDDPLSAHLVALDDYNWKHIRSKLTPTFTSGKIKGMFPSMVEVADEFRKCIIQEMKMGYEIEIKDLLGRFTTDVIGSCAFGINYNSLKDPNVIFRKMGRKIFEEPKYSRFVLLFMEACPEYARKLKLTPTWPDVSKFFLNLVSDTIKYREENNINRKDFMNLLMDLKIGAKNPDGLTIEQITAQAFVFFLAGFETSSTTMGFCLYELALNENIQQQARLEIIEILQKYDGEMCYEAIMEMKYLEQVINETLRKYPPGTILLRKAKMDYKISESHIIIEKDIPIIIPVYAIHHDPEYYPYPEIFDPDRFSEQNSKYRVPFSFLPFGEGPRNCIGMRFGMLQTKIGLATILSNFRFTIGSRTQVPLQLLSDTIVLTSAGGLWLNMESL